MSSSHDLTEVRNPALRTVVSEGLFVGVEPTTARMMQRRCARVALSASPGTSAELLVICKRKSAGDKTKDEVMGIVQRGELIYWARFNGHCCLFSIY